MACCKCKEYRWEDPQSVVYTDPEDGREYCLFHAPAEHKGMSVDEFNAQVSERIQAFIDLEDEEAWCYLSGTIFPGEICFAPSGVLPNITFLNASFRGSVSFGKVLFGGSVSFRRASFEEGANFSEVGFVGKAYFLESNFVGGAAFFEASFSKGADFFEANFVSGANFGKVSFLGGANFFEARFGWYVNFGRASFGEGANFSNVSFGGNADFDEASFGENAAFFEASFEGYACFVKASFEGSADFVSTQFNGPIRFISIETSGAILRFAYCTVPPSAMTFESCDPTCLDLVEQRDLTHIHFINASWEKNGRIKACTEDDPGRLQSTRDFYQRMKAKYKAENNEYEASKWHVAEKEAQLKLLGQDGESRFLWAMLWLYKLVSGFGEDPRRAFWVLLGLFALPLLVLTGIEVYQHFSWWDFDSERLNHVLKEWLKFIPLTRAIGENEPGGWHALMLLWQLIITLQAALFAFALRNRFRR